MRTNDRLPFAALVFALTCVISCTGGGRNLVERPVLKVLGSISNDTVWSGRVIVTGKVIVLSGVTLTIQPGTEVEFLARRSRIDEGQNRIYVQENGRIVAKGTEDSPIVFASTQPDKEWFGIELHSEHSKDEFAHCRVEGSRSGIACVASSPAIENSSFSNNRYAISMWRKAKPRIRGCSFSNNNVSIMVSMQSLPEIRDCRIEQSIQSGIYVERDAGISVQRCEIVANPVGIRKRGSGDFVVSETSLVRNTVAAQVEFEGATSVFEGNTFSNNETGLYVAMKASSHVVDSLFEQNGTGILLNARARGSIEHNEFRKNWIAVRCTRTSKPDIFWNTLSDNDIGVHCEFSSYPNISWNNFVRNRMHVYLGDNQSYDWTRAVWQEEEWSQFGKAYGRNRVVAEENYWGGETVKAIREGQRNLARFYDYHDSENIVVEGAAYRRDEVHYEPYSSAPIGDAGRRTR